ncbi:MAG: efflux transporter outer membrane subunit [Bacteroides sp.]|nr:efflux transporter outer membrane subunit [Bacteroides sp.]
MKTPTLVSALVSIIIAAAPDLCAQSNNTPANLRNPMPEKWLYTPEVEPVLPSDDQWWQSFNDPVLDSLIAMGIDNNFNLDQAARRREIARLTMQQAKSAYFPTIQASAGYARKHAAGTNTNSYSLGADMSWEIDVFGKIHQNVKAKKAAYNASRAEYLSAMVSMTAQIATYYVNFRMLQTQEAIAHEHMESQTIVLSKVETRHEVGLVSKLDVAQAKTVYYQTEATLPQLTVSMRETINSLAILLGVYPDAIEGMLATPQPLPKHQQIIPSGVPMNLLRRRPDIVSSESDLAMYAAEVGIAKKDFLPTLTLDGTIGFQSGDIDNLFNRQGFYYSIAPTLSWTVFSGFERKYAVAQAKEQMQIGIDNYNLTVMTAVAEVNNAMAEYQAAIETYEADKKVFDQSSEAFDLSIEQYTSGLSAFTPVVDAQIDRLTTANAMVTAQGNAVIALIDLYKALGGSPIQF